MPTKIAEIGIGRALRRARERQGLTLEDAALGTRLRAEYLDALEREDFAHLPGDIYVRSFLRSYGRFLGLDAGKVLGAYDRAQGRTRPLPGPVHRAPAVAASEDEALPGHRRHFPWPMAIAVAALVIVAAAGIGLFSRSASTPEPAAVETPANVKVLPRPLTVNLVVQRDVRAKITIDGAVEFAGTLKDGERRSFEGNEEITVWFESGAAAEMTVDGTAIGVPGDPTVPWEATYQRGHFRGASSKSG